MSSSLACFAPTITLYVYSFIDYQGQRPRRLLLSSATADLQLTGAMQASKPPTPSDTHCRSHMLPYHNQAQAPSDQRNFGLP